MEEKKKESKSSFFYNKILGVEILLDLGKYMFYLVGGLIVIERMIEFYINFDGALKADPIFTLAFMFAIALVPVFIFTKVAMELDSLIEESKKVKE